MRDIAVTVPPPMAALLMTWQRLAQDSLDVTRCLQP
jgi:hypothetical protein